MEFKRATGCIALQISNILYIVTLAVGLSMSCMSVISKGTFDDEALLRALRDIGVVEDREGVLTSSSTTVCLWSKLKVNR